MEHEFEKCCIVDRSPTTVLPPLRQFSSVEKRKFKRKPNCENGLSNQSPSLYEISSSASQCTSCISSPCSESNDLLKRSSVYQNSEELRGAKIVGILDLVYSSDEESSSGFISLNNEACSEFLDITFSPVPKRISQVSSDGFLEISLDSFATSNESKEFQENSLFALHNSLPAQDSAKDSPAHLRGVLKRCTKRGVPFYEFSMNLTGEILAAKICKTENSSSWIYTFYKKQRKNSTGWGFKDSNKESCTIAQMQVSSYISTEPNNNKSLHKSIVTEFVLSQRLESAAIVIEVPCEERESLKSKRENIRIDEFFNIDKKMNTAKLNVITPLGIHGLPENNSCRPLPLVDRWRCGGGCDCGGWDMGCPIVVSDNNNIEYDGEHIVLDNRHPFELYTQGTKDKTPTFSMSVIKEGHYEVDFHAHLTAVQAFSICVAVLHSTETEKQVSHCNSPRTPILEY